MTPQESRTIGRTKTLKATIVILAVMLFGLMLIETRGDFANGILFFIQDISNIHFIILLIIVFGLTYIFGGKAGTEIIIYKRNIVLTSIKYAVLIILSIIIYAAIIGIANDNTSLTDNFQRHLTTYFLKPLIKTGSLTIIPIFLIWLWATNQMRLIKKKKTD